MAGDHAACANVNFEPKDGVVRLIGASRLGLRWRFEISRSCLATAPNFRTHLEVHSLDFSLRVHSEDLKSCL